MYQLTSIQQRKNKQVEVVRNIYEIGDMMPLTRQAMIHNLNPQNLAKIHPVQAKMPQRYTNRSKYLPNGMVRNAH